MIDLAVQLIQQKSAPFKADAYRDHYQDALKALVQGKIRGHKIIAHEEGARPTGANVVDLMEALKRSVGQSGLTAAKSTPAGAPATDQPAAKGAKSPPKRRKAS